MTPERMHDLLLQEEYAEYAQVANALPERRLPDALAHNLAVACYKLGDFHAARRHLRRLVLRPDCPARTFYVLGLVERDSGNDAEALNAFTEALDRQPDFAPARLGIGTCRFRLGDLRNAADDFEEATRLAPNHVTGHYNLAVVCVAAEQWERARRAFASCLTLDSAHEQEYLSLISEIGRAQAFSELYAEGHRIKNVIGVLGNELTSLYKAFAEDLPDAFRKQIEGILEKQQRLYANMASHLSHMHLLPMELDLADLHEIMDGALVAAQGAMSRVTLRRQYDKAIGDVLCEVFMLREAFLNLILNACESMEDAEKPVLTVETARRPNGDICVQLADNGCGIRDEDFQHVFRHGFTTKQFGSGMGLSQARRVIERHGGSIELKTRAGHGTTVCLLLPESSPGEPTLANLRVRSSIFEDPASLIREDVSPEDLLVHQKGDAS